MLNFQPSGVVFVTRGDWSVHSQALVGVWIAQPFPSYSLQRSVLFQLGLSGRDAAEQSMVGERNGDGDVLDRDAALDDFDPGIGLTSSVRTGASFMKASQPPVVRSVSAVRIEP